MTASTMHRTDADLKAAVIEELAWTPGLNSTNIGVAANHGAVTLSGEVESYPQKVMAEKAATAVRGVIAFAEDITVRGDWRGVNDTDIAREAAEAIERSVSIPSGAVTAAVHNHTVTLTGQVTWHYQRQAAEHAVRFLKGVAAVVNNVTIKPVVSTTGIKAAISAALVRRAHFDSLHTTVVANADGVVTLSGTVGSWAERRDVERTAWQAAGVTDVINKIILQDR